MENPRFGVEAFDMEDLPKIKVSFEKNGFAVVKNVFSASEVEEMREEMMRIIEGMEPEEHPRCVFTTYDEEKHVADKYFLESCDKIRFFYEEGAFNEGKRMTVPKASALNKVGHALHWQNDVFRKYTFSDRIKVKAFRLIIPKKIVNVHRFEQPEVVQSMYIFKQPKIGGAVSAHIDATFISVDPIDHLLGMWIAIDDADISNGCLWFVPGSHKVDTVNYRFKRTHATEGSLLKFEGERPAYNEDAFIGVPVKKGSVVLIHGCVAHKSEANTSTKRRHSYAFHIVDRENSSYSDDNW
uniref:Phytanoyl-CoA dioxygenase domain-containing protein 1 n=1 Tax=Ascaris lumbricoides TaxID=6252 RepID=A0A0M3HMH7_ASCLU